eukprot:3245328-Rhodomonas_salina.1
MFAELNQNITPARVGQASNGFPTFLNPAVVPDAYLENAFHAVDPNPDGVCTPLDSHMSTMAS